MYEGYNAIILDHLRNPRNAGSLPEADIVVTERNDYCGDLMRMALKIQKNKIVDLRFQTFGCGISIAAGSLLTELAKEKTLSEAQQITESCIATALGGLGPEKQHGATLAAQALAAALNQYLAKAQIVPH